MTEEDLRDTRFVVPEPGGRVDRLVAERLGLGRRHAKNLIDRGCVRVDGRRSRAGTFAPTGAVVDVTREEQAARAEVAPSIIRGGENASEKPRVLWQSAGLVAFYKPSGVHTMRGRGQPCLADFVGERFSQTVGLGRSGVENGLAHRLDRDTSGIVLGAVDAETYETLRAAFAAGAIFKEYLALVAGVIDAPCTIDVPLARRRSHVRPARRGELAREALTAVIPLEAGTDWTLVRAAMRTGVTHQIRAHLALVGHPVIGDAKYGVGVSPPDVRGHQLHACRITLHDGVSLAVDPGTVFLGTLAFLRSAARAQLAPED